MDRYGQPQIYTVFIHTNMLKEGSMLLLCSGTQYLFPNKLRHRKAACYQHGLCDRAGEPGSGSSLFFIN